MSASRATPLPSKRRQVVLGTLRSLASSILLVALYYLLPLDHLARVPLAVLLVVGLALLAAAAAWQLRLILRARNPGLRAAEALATTVPLFLLLFASFYFAVGRANPANFSQHLTRTDALYFTVTTFSTVGYGDITAVSQAVRLVVTAQMLLDLLALGLGIKLFVGAVRTARQAQPGTADPGTTPPQQRPRLPTLRNRRRPEYTRNEPRYSAPPILLPVRSAQEFGKLLRRPPEPCVLGSASRESTPLSRAISGPLASVTTGV
jgi:voltage-gated potassium channel